MYRSNIERVPGRILWDELVLHDQRGVDWVRATRKEWDVLAGVIDPDGHGEVAKKLAIQERARDSVAGRLFALFSDVLEASTSARSRKAG